MFPPGHTLGRAREDRSLPFCKQGHAKLGSSARRHPCYVHPPEKHSTQSPGLLQDSRLLPCNRTPRTRAACCLSPARSRCQAPVPQKDRTDAGRGCEPAARVQPCTAITVLLIPRGFRMSEPGVPRRGQLGRGRAAIPAHVVDAPRCSLLRLAWGKSHFCSASLWARGMDRPHGQPLSPACCQTPCQP